MNVCKWNRKGGKISPRRNIYAKVLSENLHKIDLIVVCKWNRKGAFTESCKENSQAN
jgi:hypothetical protein